MKLATVILSGLFSLLALSMLFTPCAAQVSQDRYIRVYFSPPQPRNCQDLTALILDYYATTPSYQVDWYKNGVLQSNLSQVIGAQMGRPGQLQQGRYVLTKDHLNRGDTWKCVVTPVDGCCSPVQVEAVVLGAAPYFTSLDRDGDPATVTIFHAISGVPFNLLVKAADDDGDPLNYTDPVLPEGAVINQATRMLSWTPSESDAGKNYTLRFKVSDGETEVSTKVDIRVLQHMPAVDLSGYLPPVGNQGSLGSCASWAIGYYYKSFQEAKEHNWDPGLPEHQCSPLFIYNQLCLGSGSPYGGEFEILRIQGCASMKDMPYLNDDSIMPNANQYEAAMPFRSGGDSGRALTSVNDWRNHLAGGDIFVISLEVYSPVYLPDTGGNDVYDGLRTYGRFVAPHAVAVVGYDDNREYTSFDGVKHRGAFKFVNSWGSNWAGEGYRWISYDYLMSSDNNCKAWHTMVDRIGYQPRAIARLHITHPRSGDLAVNLCKDASGAKSLFMPLFVQDAYVRPNIDAAFDISDAIDAGYLPPSAQHKWLLVAEDFVNGESGIIDAFKIKYRASINDGFREFVATDTPVAIPDASGIEAFSVISGENTIPAAPLNLHASQSGLHAAAIVLTWDDNSGDETGFRLERSLDGVNYFLIGRVSENITTYLDEFEINLSTKYYYRICAYNDAQVDSNYCYGVYTRDTTPPVGRIVINAPIDTVFYPGTTYSFDVTLSLLATDTESGMGPGSQMQFSNDSITWLAPEAYATTKSWTLSIGRSGFRTVYVKFKDAAGNWSNVYSRKIYFCNPPSVVSVSPDSGIFQSDTFYTFTSVYSDLDGYENIREMKILISTSNDDFGSNSAFCVVYNRVENKLYLTYGSPPTDGVGYTLGSNNFIELPSGKLDCSQTTVSGSGNNLTINWRISFSSAMAGIKNIYLYAIDASYESVWQQKGTITIEKINNPPEFKPPLQNIAGEADSIIHFTVSVTDKDRDQLRFIRTMLPAGANFTVTYSRPGEIYADFYWTPKRGQVNTWRVGFQVSDGKTTVGTSIQITVKAKAPTFILTTSASNGAIETDPPQPAAGYAAGAKVQLTANPNTGYKFSSWSGGLTGSANPATITMNSNKTVTANVVAINNPPVFGKLESPINITVGENKSFYVSATDLDKDKLEFIKTMLPDGAALKDVDNSISGEIHARFEWTPNSGQVNSYRVGFQVTDGKTNIGTSIDITVKAKYNRAPVLNPIGIQGAETDKPLSFTISATDADGDALTYSASNLPSGAVFMGQTFSWTPAQTGAYTPVFTVKDGKGGQAQGAVTITVTQGNRAPKLAPIGNKTVVAGDEISFILTATDPDLDALTYSASGLPSGAKFDPVSNTFSWTPIVKQASQNPYEIIFKVADGKGGKDEEPVGITVRLNTPPSLDPVPSAQDITMETILTFKVSATDPDGDTLTLKVWGDGESYPPIEDIVSRPGYIEGNFRWETTAADVRTHTAIFSVSDGKGGSDSRSAVITVKPLNHAPVLDYIGNKTVAEGDLLSFTLAAGDPDGDILTYSAAMLPTGANFKGRTFTWTPARGQANSYRVGFRVSDGKLSDSTSIDITVTAKPNQPPVLNSIGAKAAVTGAQLTFTISATDADGDSLTYSANNLPSGASFAGQAFTWTPTQAGTYTPTFSVTDNRGGTAQETITITVIQDNRAPKFDYISSQTVEETKELKFTVYATDPDGDSLVYYASNLPSGAAFTGQTFKWTPKIGQAGSYTGYFGVMDSHSAVDTQGVSFTVRKSTQPKPTPPTPSPSPSPSSSASPSGR